MADGSSYRAISAGLAAERLGHALTARNSLWAVCRCGRETPVDPEAWTSQGLARHRLEMLEDRLRCVCGMRRVPLEIRGLAEASKAAAGGIYVFR